MARLFVNRRAHNRRGYTRRDGTRVKSADIPRTSFYIRDRGARGRGKKIIPPLKSGTLSGNIDRKKMGRFFSNSAATRRRKESQLAKRVGEKRVVGKLRAIQVLNKRTNPTVSMKARADARYIASSFVGKKRVRTGTGLRRSSTSNAKKKPVRL